jgi:hypothetical protein
MPGKRCMYLGSDERPADLVVLVVGVVDGKPRRPGGCVQCTIWGTIGNPSPAFPYWASDQVILLFCKCGIVWSCCVFTWSLDSVFLFSVCLFAHILVCGIVLDMYSLQGVVDVYASFV